MSFKKAESKIIMSESTIDKSKQLSKSTTHSPNMKAHPLFSTIYPFDNGRGSQVIYENTY